MAINDIIIEMQVAIDGLIEAMQQVTEAIQRATATITKFAYYVEYAKLESRRWLWPWMGALLTLAVAAVAVWSG